MVKDLAAFFVVLDQQIGLIGAEEGIHPPYGVGSVHHHPHDLRAVEVA